MHGNSMQRKAEREKKQPATAAAREREKITAQNPKNILLILK